MLSFFFQISPISFRKMMLISITYTFWDFFSNTKIMYISYYENVKKSMKNWHILVNLTCLCMRQKVYISGMAKTLGTKGDS